MMHNSRITGKRKPPVPKIEHLNYLTTTMPGIFQYRLPKRLNSKMSGLDFDSWRDFRDTLQCTQANTVAVQRLCRATAPARGRQAYIKYPY